MSTRPCRHPRCDRDNGQPIITQLGMCEPCQRHTHRLLGWLVLDWVDLTLHLPTPTGSSGERKTAQKVYGHPAEWASDTARRIADTLNATHDALADTLGETPPPHPGITDRIRVRAAWHYLECRIHILAEQDWVTDQIGELQEVHQHVRSRLGHTRPRQALPTPCPSCELRTVTRTLDPHHDQIECGSCGWHIRSEDYESYARAVLDAVLDEPAA